MKKSFKLLALVLCLILCFGIFAGCEDKKDEESEKPTIVGSWESVDISGAIYHFEKDGKGSYEFAGAEMPFTYTDDGKKVVLQYENSDAPNEYSYTIEGDKLLIEDSFGEIVEYKKI